MHVLLLNQFFHPDLSAVAQLATDLAEDLVALGFRVTAVAARGSYLGGTRFPHLEDHRGIRIVRVQSTSFGKATLAARAADYTSFLASSFARVLAAERPDIVFVGSAPPLVPAIGAAMRAYTRTPFVYWAQDLYPDLAIEFGLLRRDSLPAKMLQWLSSQVVRRADAIVTLGDAMAARLVRKGASPHRVHVVPNWADPDHVRPMQHASNSFRIQHDLAEKRVILYSGNIGRGHDIDTIIATAELLREHKEIVFLFVGDGARRVVVERGARNNPRIRLLPYQPRALLSESLSAADLHVVTQDANTEGLIEPSKLYGVMAAGRPILFIGPRGSEAAKTVLRESIGDVVANGDARGAANAISTLLASGPLIGQRARNALERSYGRKARTAEIARILNTIAGTSQTISYNARRNPS